MITPITRALLGTLLLFAPLVISPAQAVPPKERQKISEHLEFFGFTSTIDGESLKATSPQHLPLYVSQTDYGIRVTLAFSTNANAVNNKADLMEILNKLNAEALIIKFYLAQNDIVFEANYVGDYERQDFGIFMQAYLSDYDLVYKNPELAKYIDN